MRSSFWLNSGNLEQILNKEFIYVCGATFASLNFQKCFNATQQNSSIDGNLYNSRKILRIKNKNGGAVKMSQVFVVYRMNSGVTECDKRKQPMHQSNKIVWRVLGVEAVLLNPFNGSYFGFNKVGCSL